MRVKQHYLLILLVFNFYGILLAQSISTTTHNMSVNGPGTIKASSESEICIFCHTPHSSSPKGPLWNRNDPGVTYTLYNSSTINATPGQPDGSSILCLSCHDGTIALGNVVSRLEPISFSGGIIEMPSVNSNLSADLSDDHPISFVYNSILASLDDELIDPVSISGVVKLENSKLQCVSCHEPHSNIYGKFLVASVQYSLICLYCHQKTNWNLSSHKTSTSTWNSAGSDPWFHTDYNSVAENGCENCHNTHNASGSNRLMKASTGEGNCVDCHNGNVAATDIQSDINKTYSHDVYSYNQVHDAAEDAVVLTQHVECADCHNPHESRNQVAVAPNASGSIAGVIGVNSNGSDVTSIQYQYELCYRCHASSPSKPGSPTSRQIEQNNVMMEFDLSNPSYHPVEGPGQNSNSPSLISPLTESSIIYCTDCHASDGVGAPAGPHGSIYPQILKYNYTTVDYTPESYATYELCYQCHDRDQLFDSFGPIDDAVHKRHVQQQSTPCNVCHDPHGISGAQGNSTNNTHLINFDLSVVTPNRNGRLEFIDGGEFTGSCYLNCHGSKSHNPRSY